MSGLKKIWPAAAAWLPVVFILASASHLFAADIVPDGPPPETPESVASQIYLCIGKAGAEKAACESAVVGLTALDFVNLSDGCNALTNEDRRRRCGEAWDKLRPLFRPAAGPESLPGNLLAADYFALSDGCSALPAPSRQPCA